MNTCGSSDTDALLLKWHMNQHGDTLKTLAEALGIYPRTLYMKYKAGGKQQFTQREILTIALRYKLSAEEVAKIFFKPII